MDDQHHERVPGHMTLIKLTLAYLLHLLVVFIVFLIFYYCRYSMGSKEYFIIVLVAILGTFLAWTWNISCRDFVRERLVIFAMIFIVCCSASVSGVAIVAADFGSRNIPPAYNISVVDIANYRTDSFTFYDGDIIINATQCVKALSVGIEIEYALAPLVPTTNFSDAMIPAFVAAEMKDSKCDLPANINWHEPIRQAIILDLDGIEAAIPLIYKVLNMTYDTQALRVPVVQWGYISSFYNDSKLLVVIWMLFVVGIPTLVYALATGYLLKRIREKELEIIMDNLDNPPIAASI